MRIHRGLLLAATVPALLAGCATATSGHAAPASIPGPVLTDAPASSPTAAATPAITAPGTPSGTDPTSAGPDKPSVTVVPAPSKPIRVATVTAADATYTVEVWAQAQDKDCAAHAYGQPVIHYLLSHSCLGVNRLLATTTVNGRPAGIAQSTVAFGGAQPTSYRAAGDFRALVSQDGTGNINDLMREGRRLPAGPDAVPSPDAFAALAQDNGVVIVESWYLDGPTPDNDPALVKMAQETILQY